MIAFTPILGHLGNVGLEHFFMIASGVFVVASMSWRGPLYWMHLG